MILHDIAGRPVMDVPGDTIRDVIERLQRESVSRWRRLDLHGMDLSGADLSGMRLDCIRFTISNLSRANLAGASMRHADLLGADLRGADVTGANWKGATLWCAVVDDTTVGLHEVRVNRWTNGYRDLIDSLWQQRYAVT